ncbi:MAG: alpha/beta fold hydrolase [Gaiellaceae bacterium]
MNSRLHSTQNARQLLLEDIPVTERRVELAGVSTAVLEGGSGPPVVLLHGPVGHAGHWLRVLPALAESHRVVAPDLPGQGASELTGDALDAQGVLDWLEDLIGDACPAPPALVGFTLGGAIAARFAAARGDMLTQLVLVDMLGLTRFAPPPEFGQAVHTFLAQPSEETHEELWRYCASDLESLREQMGQRWELFRAYNLERARTPSVRAALDALMEQFAPPIEPEVLARITVPTTLVWGRQDLATPVGVAEAASKRYGWPLEVIERAGDEPPIEQPEAFLRVLNAALRPASLAEVRP